MPDPSPSPIPLVLAGAALVATGLVRLLGLGLGRMPRVVAAALGAGGLAVAALGFALPNVSEPAPQPRVSLEPETSMPSGTPVPIGTITGRVVDGHREPLPGRQVVVRRFRGTQVEASLATATDANGRFRFGGLRVAPTIAHTVSTDFGGVTFRSNLIVLDPHASRAEVELRIARPTEDPDVLRVDVDSTAFVGDERGAQVLQVLRIHNTSDDAYVGGLPLPVLAGAAAFEARSGLDQTRLRLRDGGLVSIAPVLPGTLEIVYTYALPVRRSRLAVRRGFVRPTEHFELLVGGELSARRVIGAEPEGTVELSGQGGDRPYARFTRGDLGPRDTVTAELVVEPSGGRLRPILIGLAALAAIGLVVVPLVRRRRSPGDAG